MASVRSETLMKGSSLASPGFASGFGAGFLYNLANTSSISFTCLGFKSSVAFLSATSDSLLAGYGAGAYGPPRMPAGWPAFLLFF